MKMKAITAFLVFLVILTLPFLVSAVNGDILSQAPQPKLEKAKAPAGVENKCVEEVPYMRANHMNILETARVQVVRNGLREKYKKYSLENCFTCHRNRAEFCDKCHSYAGVEPGCFGDRGGCHYANTKK